MSDIFLAILPDKNNIGYTRDLQYCILKMLKSLGSSEKQYEGAFEYTVVLKDTIKISTSCIISKKIIIGPSYDPSRIPRVKYQSMIIIKILSLHLNVHLNLRSVILVKFYQFCMMAIGRVTKINAFNRDIIKYILSFINFDDMIMPLPENKCNTIYPTLLSNIIIILSEQDKENMALDCIIRNLKYIDTICSIMY